ncbi:MAG: DUF523 domain-containing protein [Peptococcia bacterium]
MIIVSACLLGLNTRYDGSAKNANSILLKYSHMGMYIPLCPEQLGGLATPRFPAEIINGSGIEVLEGKAVVKNKLGEEVTSQFIKGAKQVLFIAQIMPVTAAILKEGSPSCGCRRIYDGTFENTTKDGQGITAALLRQNYISVYSDEELTEELLIKTLKI